MRGRHIIALDVSCQWCDYVVMTASGRIPKRGRVATRLPDLIDLVSSVPRPRELVIEEGPMADWLLRGVRPHVNEAIACNPRRNALIARESDKDDPIDAEKLAQLYRGGYVQPVYHSDSFDRLLFKRHVGLYHDRVRQAVRLGQRILWELRAFGVFAGAAELKDAKLRERRLTSLPACEALRGSLRLVMKEYDLARKHVALVRRRVAIWSRQYEPIGRFMQMPGVKIVRAATFFAYVDTPRRFHSKAALWRYMGIGLERRHSGSGPVRLRVTPAQRVCRPLKNMILGAAKTAIAAGDNPFAERYKEWIHAGVSPRNARRSVARLQAAVLWGMWKNGSVYRPEWVGQSAMNLSAPMRPQSV